MAGLLSLPAANLVPRAGPDPRRMRDRRVPRHRRPCGAPRGAVRARPRARRRRRPDRPRRRALRPSAPGGTWWSSTATASAWRAARSAGADDRRHRRRRSPAAVRRHGRRRVRCRLRRHRQPRVDGEGLRLRRPWRALRAGERGQGADHLLGPGFPPQGDDAARQPQRHCRGFRRVIAAIADGDIATDRLITHRTDSANAVRDIPRWAHEKVGLVKAVVELE